MPENTEFEPELGQILFGQECLEHGVGKPVIRALEVLSDDLQDFLESLGHGNNNPFDNTGNAFGCATFTAHAYSWVEDEQPCNFFHVPSGTGIKWYKYLGRSMTANKPLDAAAARAILKDCMAALERIRSGKEEYLTTANGACVPYPTEMNKEANLDVIRS